MAGQAGSGKPAGDDGQARKVALPREEVGGSKPPAPGEKFLVYRLGSSETIANRNAGNADSVARFIMGTEDAMGPISSRAGQVFAYEVTVDKPFGKYEGLTGARRAASDAPGRVVRGNEVAYSFPEGTYTARLVGAKSLEELRAKLKEGGFENFDEAGSDKGAAAIRESFTESKGPPAQRAGSTEPPPPPGNAGSEAGPARPAGQAGEPKQVSPVAAAANDYAAQNPAQLVRTGTNSDGTPIVRTVAEFLADARAEAARVREDAKLLDVAAGCMFGAA